MNTQVHSVTGKTPYEIVFRQTINCAAWIASRERQTEPIETEDGLPFTEADLNATDVQDQPLIIPEVLLYLAFTHSCLRSSKLTM